MTHLPYIAAAYGLALAIGAGFAVSAWLRVGRARQRLAVLDPRQHSKPRQHMKEQP